MTDDLAASIVRKLVIEQHPGDQHYLDIEDGVFDSRIDLTDEEKAYLRAVAGGPHHNPKD